MNKPECQETTTTWKMTCWLLFSIRETCYTKDKRQFSSSSAKLNTIKTESQVNTDHLSSVSNSFEMGTGLPLPICFRPSIIRSPALIVVFHTDMARHHNSRLTWQYIILAPIIRIDWLGSDLGSFGGRGKGARLIAGAPGVFLSDVAAAEAEGAGA
jgi:hypothetical protein